MQVRSADAAEIDHLARLWHDGWHQTHGPLVPQELTRLRTPKSFRERLVTHIFAAGDQYLDSDVVFGVKKSLVEEYRAHHGGKAHDGRAMDGDWFSLEREFRLARLG